MPVLSALNDGLLVLDFKFTERQTSKFTKQRTHVLRSILLLKRPRREPLEQVIVPNINIHHQNDSHPTISHQH